MIARVTSPAKINLGLEILGRRPDGYHEIRTILQMISLADEVDVSPSAEMRLTCDDPRLNGEENLALAAARLWSDRIDPEHRTLSIKLAKRVPAAAGLGGASGNAASVLLTANRLFGLEPPAERLHALAAELGSDVPFFLDGPAAEASSRGEVLERLPPLGDCRIVLATPEIKIPRKTATMYAALIREDFSSGETVAAGRRRLECGLPPEPAQLFNAFERPLLRMYPKLESFPEIMRSFADGRAGLSGAGPTWFAVLGDEWSARALIDELRKRHPTARLSIERPLALRPAVEFLAG